MKAQKYFNSLNYSLGNEDTRFEGEIVKGIAPKKVVSICGSGSRCLPLFHDELKELVLVDVSEQQLFLVQLRLETIKQFSIEEFKLFWGYAPYRSLENCSKRESMFSQLGLNRECRDYFAELFLDLDWQSPLYDGKWEKTFILFSKLIQKVMSTSVLNKMFSHNSIESQRDYFKNEFPRWKWNILINIIGNKKLFNVLLYKGDFVKKNSEKTYFRYYKDAYDHIFENHLLKNNFFIQLCCFGYIKYDGGNLYEASLEVFQRVKRNIGNVKITYEKENILDVIARNKDIDFISFSDVPSYFSGETEKYFLKNTKKSLSDNALIVLRHYLRKANANRDGFDDISAKYSAEISKEQVQMYDIEVLKNV